MALKIGALAKATGVTIDTVRYYERIGLLSPESRTDAGYREYAPETVKRLRFVRKAQRLGFSLEEIAELLVFGSSPESTAGDILQITEQKIAEQKTEIDELTQLRDSLVHLALDCTGEGPVQECPILNHFYDESDAVLPSAKTAGTVPATASTGGITAIGPSRTPKKENIMNHDFDACTQACLDCMTACARCLDACIGDQKMADCAKLCRDCMIVCNTCAILCASGSDNCASLCKACADICDACAEECEMHDSEHCRKCAEACRKCAEECRKMA